MLKPKFHLFFMLSCLPMAFLFGQGSAEKPKLVVGIVVDQMRYDYLSRYAGKYSENGFKKLLTEGFFFENHNLNYVPTNTAPGHASIYTGTTPSVHGILGNSWYDKTKKRAISCVYDATEEPVGVGINSEKKSPRKLLVNTIGDLNRSATQLKGKTISIALKDRAAVLSGGLTANAAYWFSGKDLGQWISSSYYIDTLPQWVRSFNETDAVNDYTKEWTTFYDIDLYFESDTDNDINERGFRGKETSDFPYDLNALKAENGGFDILKSTPFGNSYTLDFALKAIEGEDLGSDADTDFLLISLSSTDYIGHNFGVDSKEVEDAYVRLDKDLAGFLETLDNELGKENYTLFLTSDHGASKNSNHLNEKGIAAGYFKEGTFKNDLKGHMFQLYKEANVIENISDNQVFLDTTILANLNLEYSEVTAAVKDFILKYPQITEALTRLELLNETFTEGLPLMIQNGFNENRSGDLFYLLEPNIVVYAKQGSSHGSGYEFDTHIPLIFYGKGIKKGRSSMPTNSTMIAPTLSKLLNLPNPEHFKSSPLFN